jgi:hypothetical protein
MVYAVVAQCPYFRGLLIHFDAVKAKAIPGVLEVFDIPTDPHSAKPRDTAEPGQTRDGPATRYVSVHRQERPRRYRIGKTGEQPCMLLVLLWIQPERVSIFEDPPSSEHRTITEGSLLVMVNNSADNPTYCYAIASGT